MAGEQHKTLLDGYFNKQVFYLFIVNMYLH
jgi:hypothetical protein